MEIVFGIMLGIVAGFLISEAIRGLENGKK